MTEGLEVRAEIARLARVLHQPAERLAYLSEIPSEDLHRLRDQVTEVLFAGSGILARLASASKLLPIGLVATIGQRAFGPVLSARIAGLLDPDRAVQMAARLPTPFISDVSCELDPRRAEPVISRIPPAQIAEICRELVGRRDYVTMGNFVGYLEAPAINAAAKEMDDVSMIQVALVLDNKQSFGLLLDQLSPTRLESVIDTIAAEELWVEALDLLGYLTDAKRAEVIDLAAARDDAVLDALIESAQSQDRWEQVLPLTQQMSLVTLKRFAGLSSIQNEATLTRVVEVVAGHPELWPALVPVLSQLPERAQARVVASINQFGENDALLDEIGLLVQHDEPGGLWADGVGLLAMLKEPLQERLAERLASLDAAQRAVIAEHARAAGVLDRLGPLGPALAG